MSLGSTRRNCSSLTVPLSSCDILVGYTDCLGQHSMTDSLALSRVVQVTASLAKVAQKFLPEMPKVCKGLKQFGKSKAGCKIRPPAAFLVILVTMLCIIGDPELTMICNMLKNHKCNCLYFTNTKLACKTAWKLQQTSRLSQSNNRLVTRECYSETAGTHPPDRAHICRQKEGDSHQK